MQSGEPTQKLQFDVHHPHDSVVKFILGVNTHMGAFLASYLPEELAQPIRLEDTRIEPGSFIDDSLKASYSDILASAPFLGRNLRFYFLFEHKSSQDEDTPAQLLKLLPEVTLRLKREREEAGLTPVIALVLHHGERPWQGSLRLMDHYNLPDDCRQAFERYLLGYEAVLVDLARINMDEIRNIPAVEALLKSLKAVKEGLEEPLLAELKTMAQAGELKGYLATLLLYLLCAGKTVTRQQVLDVAKTSRDDKVVSEIMTGAEILREEGKIEGKQEGFEQGQLAGQIVFIQEMLGRPPASIRSLEQRRIEDLRAELALLRAEWLGRKQ